MKDFHVLAFTGWQVAVLDAKERVSLDQCSEQFLMLKREFHYTNGSDQFLMLKREFHYTNAPIGRRKMKGIPGRLRECRGAF